MLKYLKLIWSSLLLAFGWVAVVVVILCLIVACVVASVFYPFIAVGQRHAPPRRSLR